MDPTRQFIRELIDLRRAGASCAIDVVHGDRTTTLTLLAGEIVDATSTVAPEPIGRILARHNAISREHQVELLEWLSRVANIRARFGELAIGLGYAESDAVGRALVAQRRSLVVRILCGTPSWTKRDLPTTRDGASDVVMSIESLVLEAVRGLDGPGKAQFGLEEIRRSALVPASPLDQLAARFELTQAECDWVGGALAGSQTAADLVEKEIPGVDARALLTALAATGAATVREPGPAAPAAPAAWVRVDCVPLPAWALVDVASAKRATAELVMAPLADGTETPVGRAGRSERAFLSAREAFRRGDIKQTLRSVGEALAIDPKHVEGELFERWCRQWLGKLGMKLEACVAFERAARAALAEVPDLAIAYFLLGEALQSTQPELARKHVTNALRLDKPLFDGVRDKRLSPPDGPAPNFPKSTAKLAVGRGLVEQKISQATMTNTLIMEAAPSLPPAARPPSSWRPPARGDSKTTRVVLSVIAVILAGAILGVVTANVDVNPRTPTPTSIPTPTPIPIPIPIPIPDAAPDLELDPDPDPIPDATPPPIPDAAPTRSLTPIPSPPPLDAAPPADPRKGRVILPANALGHRVFIDGQLSGSNVAQLDVACGKHELKIGSKSAPRTIEVPCGGEIDLR